MVLDITRQVFFNQATQKMLLKPGNRRDQTTIYQLIKSNFT